MQRCCHFLILIVFILAGCAHRVQNAPKSELAPLSIPSKQSRPVTSFGQIDVQGKININLHTGYKQPQVILTGDSRDLAQVKTVVVDNTLFLSLGSGYPRYGAIQADIRSKFLTGFSYVGAGFITGNQLYTPSLNLNLANQGFTNLGGTIGLRQLNISGKGSTQISGISSRYLEVHLKGNPKVKLAGDMNLAKLDMDGSASLNIYWIKSNNLKISARKGARIQMAGVVNRLEVELAGFAHFNGRYLRAQRSFVRTRNRSRAEVSSLNHQSTLATDASDIFYYNLPVTRADFMAYNGAVLDLREWDQPFLNDFTRYNHQYP